MKVLKLSILGTDWLYPQEIILFFFATVLEAESTPVPCAVGRNDMIWYICWLQLGCHPVAVLQHIFKHKQYIEQHK